MAFLKGALDLWHTLAFPLKCFRYATKVFAVRCMTCHSLIRVMARNGTIVTLLLVLLSKINLIKEGFFRQKSCFLIGGATTDYRKGPFYQIKTNFLHEDNA